MTVIVPADGIETGNAVAAADIKVVDALRREYPWTTLQSYDEPVVLPSGYQGSIEVRHLNIGAGRIVVQELKRIDDGLSGGELFEAEKWQEMMANWKSN